MLSASAAMAGSLIGNGSFEQNTGTYNPGTGTVGTVVTNSDLTDWSVSSCVSFCSGVSPFMFVVKPNYNTAGLWWYPTTISSGGLVNFYNAGSGPSPDGGDAIGVDAGTNVASLQQTVTGLKSGHTYALTFFQASTQAIYTGITGGFTADWQVSLGGSTAAATTMTNAVYSYTPWTQQTLDFTANSASEVLSFLAQSANPGLPPFLLLDGVSLTDISVPEPGTAALVLAGVGALVAFGRGRRRAA